MTEAVDKQAFAAAPLDVICSLTAGEDLWSTPEIHSEALSVPKLRMTDGPVGARGEFFGSKTTACFPCSAGLGATFDRDLVYEVGAAIARQARAKGYGMLLAPTVNLQRSPLGGRNFECYSEDPWLTATMGSAFIAGVQSQGVAACVKHFVCNDCETNRARYSSVVDQRTLREVYLLPFEVAVKSARVAAVMAAYNRLNGVFCSEHKWLLDALLRKEWGFSGVVVSDWGAVHDGCASIKAGLDLEMPGPARHMGSHLVAEVQEGRLRRDIVEEAARRVAELAGRLSSVGGLESGGDESAPDLDEDRRLARRAAQRSFVLLKNEGVLPISLSDVRRVALLGPFAAAPAIQGGGSAKVRPHYVSTPLEAFRQWLEPQREVVHVPFPKPRPLVGRPDPALFEPIDEAKNRFYVRFFAAAEPAGEPVVETKVKEVSSVWGGRPPGLPAEGPFSASWQGRLVVGRSGRYLFGLSASGGSRLFLDNNLVLDNWSDPEPGCGLLGSVSREVRAEVFLEAGGAHELVVEFVHDPGKHRWVPGDFALVAINLGIEEVAPPAELGASVEAAAGADLALVVVGRDDEFESEGFDRATMDLVGFQNELVHAVAAVAKKTLVVVNVGSAVSMPWLDEVDAVLLALFPGQEFGNALVEVASGQVPPGGKLPFSIPRRTEDCPSYPFHVPEGEAVYYGERYLVGYRGMAAKGIEPLFPFGYGLTYGRIVIEDVKVEEAEGTGWLSPKRYSVAITVRNLSEWPASEVIQVYAAPARDGASSSKSRLSISGGGKSPSLDRPPFWLVGFARVDLAPESASEESSKVVTIALEDRHFAKYDPSKGCFEVPQGPYELRIGLSSRDIAKTLTIEL
jgi:beta-glucosidase